MSELISGKEALIALANGSVVQGNIGFGWSDVDLNDDILLNSFITERNRYGVAVKFRLKPRTISINGIEVPCCGENYKEGEEVYVLDDCCDERGYIEYSVSGHNFEGLLPKLWWRTEEEIKQVVAALRSVFKGGV